MKRFLRILPSLVTVAGLATFAAAQGSDSCSTAQAIAGFGTFNFTTGTTGTEGQTAALCNQSGSTAIARDVWYTWTATSSGNVTFATCAGSGLDTKIAVYTGAACPAASGPALVCNDDGCALQSTVTFLATSGVQYKLQVGVYTGTAGGSGTFTMAAGGTSCPLTTGPDVIVGSIQGIANYTAAGGLDAVSLGTYSCNVGTVVIQWQANNPLHPVIGGCLYKWKNSGGYGRFEQIGMSWLKHGFLALADNLCCTCNNPGTGSLLGVGCADPYTAARNGSQSGLGPRWQVNAHTGVFTYPPANPAFAGAPARRCEALQSDLENSVPGSIRYFGEAQYVTQDDATAGNQNNNASRLELSYSSGTTFGIIGTTTRMSSAIRAWPIVEPGVVLSDVQVAGDGLIVVGSHATSLGGGQYHYEFAVYNMNADRNVGTFSVPLGTGVTVSNVGFHDITYRNGDGPGNVAFSGVDWTPTVTGSSVSWETQTQAVNNSANAIRWGTTYNFRFDANVAPISGSVTLGLWKTGSPSVNAIAETPGNNAPVFTSFCSGDGSGTACPCGNSGAAGNGCASSVNAAGGNLAASGSPSISGDTMVLSGSGMPNSSALYFQGTSQAGGGAGTVFGDGLRCAGGTVIRLGTKTNVAGASQYPEGGDLSISVKGVNSVGGTRTYQCWYRNAAAFCTGDTFNLTNGVQATWIL